jgi:hypothetical protein
MDITRKGSFGKGQYQKEILSSQMDSDTKTQNEGVWELKT